MARGVGGRGPANIMKHIKGLHFPITKNKLIRHAREAAGPDTLAVVSLLKELPLPGSHIFSSSAEILRQVFRKRIPKVTGPA